MDTSIEEHLSSIESAAAPVYEALLGGQVPGYSQARMDFAHFVGMMYARTTTMRRFAAELRGRDMQVRLYATAQDPHAFEAAIQSYEQAEGVTLDRERREEMRRFMLDPTDFRFEIAKEVTLPVLKLGDELAPTLFDMTWNLMTARDGFLITSDHPVTRAVHRDTIHPIFGDRGFLNRTAEVTFPLSPHVLLCMSYSTLARRSVLLPYEVEAANRMRAANSERYLYAHQNHPGVAQLAQNYRHTRNQLTTTGLGPKRFAPITVY
jgi:hypothetical protein